MGRIAFLGTGSFGVPLLREVAARADELLVVSQPDRPAGRGMRSRSSAVAAWARGHGLDVATPERLRSREGRGALARFEPDGLLLAAYGQLVPEDVLALAHRPPLNVHPSLLPRHRGATPIPGAILAGDAETGVTVIVMTPRLDAGPIVGQWRIPLRGAEDAPALEAKLAGLAAARVPEVFDAWTEGRLVERAQDEEQATYTRTLRREDGLIDWRAPAVVIDRRVRGLQPWPGAWTTLDGRRLHLRRARALGKSTGDPPGTLIGGRSVRVACGAGALELLVVQPEGRRPMTGDAWLRGLRGVAERRLTLGESVGDA